MKTKFLALLLLIAIITTTLSSCEVLKLTNHILDFVPKPDSSDTNIDLDINIGGTSAHVHTESIIPAIESTCTEHGKTEGKKCLYCNAVIVPQEEAPLKAHTYDNNVDKYCNVCGHEREIDCAHQGTTEFLPAKESTCTEVGWTQGVKCTVCGEIIVAQESIPFKDHVSSDWIIDEEATTEKEGARHIECVICGTVTARETIPVILPVEESLTFELNDNGNSYMVTGIGTVTQTELIIPSSYQDKPVTKIKSRAFYNCTTIVSVTIPHSIIEIESSAFEGCTALEKAIISDSVKYIGFAMFLNCSALNYVEIGSSVTEIKNYAFEECKSLTSITIPDSVEIIGSWTFKNCYSLVNVKLGKNITTIGRAAFSNCNALESIDLPDSITTMGPEVFYYCKKLKSIDLPDSLVTIDSYMFYYCTSLKNVTIPNSVTTINEQVFYSCYNLTNIYFTGTVNEWNKITKKLSGSPRYTIYCTNGQIATDGTITYN